MFHVKQINTPNMQYHTTSYQILFHVKQFNEITKDQDLERFT